MTGMTRDRRRRRLLLASALAMLAFGGAQAQEAPMQSAKEAQPDVVAANRAVLSQLSFEDRQDFEDATRGFIATIPDPQ